MTQYVVQFTSSSAKEYRTLPKQIQNRVKALIDKLIENPRPVGVKKLVARDSYYRMRIGDYRIVYEIVENQILILVTRIRHRREAYRT